MTLPTTIKVKRTTLLFMIVSIFNFSGCKLATVEDDKEKVAPPEQMRQVATLSALEQNLGKSLCQALDQKRALFRTLHSGKSFDFQLEKYECGNKKSTEQVSATLKTPSGAAMSFESTPGHNLFFTDVVTSTEGITHFVCDIVLAGKILSNTVILNNVETIQLRLGGNVSTSSIIEIAHFVASNGVQTLTDIETITVHVKPTTVSDFTGLEIDRVVAKRCSDSGKFTNALRQTSLEKVP